jgi:hypothetical protein
MAASLPNEPDDLLITDELHHRIAHKADYQREKLAIQDLARQMAEQPDQGSATARPSGDGTLWRPVRRDKPL